MKRTLLFFTAAILMISGASCQSKDNTTNQQRALKAQQTITPVRSSTYRRLGPRLFC